MLSQYDCQFCASMCLMSADGDQLTMWTWHAHAQETAINIGFACSLLRTDMAQFIVNGGTKEVW